MTEQKAASILNFEGWCCAIEDLDAELLASFYADDAEVKTLGKCKPFGPAA